MADAEHVKLLMEDGVEQFNRWRQTCPKDKPDLNEADLAGLDLRGINFAGADLARADLRGAILTKANLSFANLREARLSSSNLEKAKLNGATLISADLTRANLKGAVLRGVDLTNANLSAVIIDDCAAASLLSFQLISRTAMDLLIERLHMAVVD